MIIFKSHTRISDPKKTHIRKKNITEYQRVTNRVSVVSMAGNLLLTFFKLMAGLLGRSSAMISDAAHSFSDILGGLIVIVGVGISEKEADEEHPYGHERLESAASLLLSFILALAGIGIFRSALDKITTGEYLTSAAPGRIALAAAIVSIVVKEGMFWYTMHYAGKISSGSLKAEAWHHRSDALSSVGSLVGIAGARLGMRVLDPIAGMVISVFILKAAWDIFTEAMGGLTDRSVGGRTEERIRSCVEEWKGIRSIDLLRTREFGRKIYVDLEVSMDGDLSLAEAHAQAEGLHDLLEKRFPDIKHVMIHVNPYTGGSVKGRKSADEKQDRAASAALS